MKHLEKIIKSKEVKIVVGAIIGLVISGAFNRDKKEPIIDNSYDIDFNEPVTFDVEDIVQEEEIQG